MFSRIINYFLPFKLYIAISLFSSILVAGANLILPLIVKGLIDKVLFQKNLVYLNFISLFIVVLFLLKGIFFYLQSYYAQKIALSVVNRLKKEIYKHLTVLPFKFFREKHSGDITSYIINDLNLIQSVLSNSFFNGILDLLVVIGSISFLFIINFKLASFSFIFLPLLGIIISRIGNLVRGITKGIQGKMSELTSHLGDSLSGISVIFTFSTQDRERRKFNGIVDEVMSLSLKDSKLKSLLPPLVELFLSFGLTFVLWFGGRDVIEGKMTSGDLIAFLGYLVLASSPLARLSNAYYSIKKIQGAFERIFEILDTEKMIEPKNKGIIPKEVKGRIDFVDVSFSHKGKPIFSHLNLTINPGENVALIGPNGEGKSTFLYLILRLFDPIEGKILLDGIDIKRLNINFLRKHVGIVLQESYLFPGTIYDNIVYGEDKPSKDMIEDVLAMLGLHDVFSRLPSGIYTEVGEGGARLSGGERHRISLARTLMLNPKILLLDEATSSLDPSSRREFQVFLNKATEGRTTIFVTHYREELDIADRIFLVKDGKLTPINSDDVDRFFRDET